MTRFYDTPDGSMVMVVPAVRVYNQMQYETIVNSHHYTTTAIAGFTFGQIKKNKDGTVCEDEFPLYVQLAWLPKCGRYIHVMPKTYPHCNFIEYDDVPKCG